MMTTEVCAVNINRSVESPLCQVKALNVYQATKSLRYEGLVTNLLNRFFDLAGDSCVSSHGSECSGSLASDFSQGVRSSGLSE